MKSQIGRLTLEGFQSEVFSAYSCRPLLTKYTFYVNNSNMRFVHGTSTSNLSTIESIGLAPPLITDNVTEKRQARLDVVHLLEEKHIRLAGGYALRSVVHFGGEPILVLGEVPDDDIDLAIPGRNAFPDIYSTPSVSPDLITDIIAVEASIEDMSELFKAHKS